MSERDILSKTIHSLKNTFAKIDKNEHVQALLQTHTLNLNATTQLTQRATQPHMSNLVNTT